ncbi:TauD-domain-containing protein [Backusella circina FSU 941]|nr:TauD-domain-containing protein [Backusella circina FSU 941]
MAPNVESITQEFEKLDLQELARTKGRYLVYPETKYPNLETFKHDDPAARGDPKKASLYDNAEKIFDLTPHIGTEIHGLQLNQLNDQQKDDLALLVAERGVVFFRDQDINVYEGVEFGKHFGPLHIHNTFGHPPNLPEVHVVYFDQKTPTSLFELERTAADGWHSDVTYENQPAGLTLLKIDTLPATGGDTLWASGYTAYDRLSPAMQKFLEGLEAVHSGQQQVDEALRAGHTIRRTVYEHAHPIIRTHPVTGWKSLFVQPGFTRRIVGLSKRESDLILKFLFEHIAGGVDFQVRFKWQENSVAVWDNRTTNHNAVFDYLSIGRRHGWRVTPQAEAPYFDPKSKSRKEDLIEKGEL